MQKNTPPDLNDNLRAAFKLYNRLDKYQFNVEVGSVLFEMLRTGGGTAYSGLVLQMAADATNTDTQFQAEKSHDGNDYAIDVDVAESWYQQGFTTNALPKYLEALEHAKRATYPDEEAEFLALGAIYDRLAVVSQALHQNVDVVVYEQASIALAGRSRFDYFTCYAYYFLNQYDDATRTCTETLGREYSLPAYYWRARAYRDSAQPESALKDYRIVADSQHNFRTSAAIDMSVIYDNLKNYRASLDVLNKYQYLYDKNIASSGDIAVAYNNRCYAYMQLDDLKKALDDCNQSLKYDTLPDALRKQQDLIKRLKAHESPL